MGRPQDAVKQTGGESGKTKAHTVKTVLLLHARLTRLFRSATYGGRGQDKRRADM